MTKLSIENFTTRHLTKAAIAALALVYPFAIHAAEGQVQQAPAQVQKAQPQQAKPQGQQAQKPAQAAPAQQAPKTAQAAQGQQAQKPAQAAPAQQVQKSAQAAPAQQAQKQQVEANAITKNAIGLGVKRCAAKMNNITNTLVKGTAANGAINLIPNQNPDAQIISTSLELSFKEMATPIYASADFAPTNDGCGSVTEVVAYWQTSCNDTYKGQFSAWKQVGTLSKGIPILGGNGNSRVFLMPAGTGCVSIRKDVVW